MQYQLTHRVSDSLDSTIPRTFKTKRQAARFARSILWANRTAGENHPGYWISIAFFARRLKRAAPGTAIIHWPTVFIFTITENGTSLS